MLDNFEIFVRWYLRFNGYFTIENFVVHDPGRVSGQTIGNQTEVDTLEVRLPHSREEIGVKPVRNDPTLVSGSFVKLFPFPDYRVVAVQTKALTGHRVCQTLWSCERPKIGFPYQFVGLPRA